MSLSDSDWQELIAQCSEVTFSKGHVVFDVGVIPDGLLFVTEGIAAAELILPDGRCIVHRFFERRQLCTTITAAWLGTETADSITTVSRAKGICIPRKFWLDAYLYGGALGVYFRKKALESIVFDKELIRVKTLNSTAESYDFLSSAYDRVVELVSQKDIARFIGVTPEGLSRFLKSRRQVLDGSGAGSRPEKCTT